MGIDSKKIMDLRQRTGAGVNDISAALQQANGDAERAIVLLRERGAVKAAKKAARTTGVGIIEAYRHANGRVGVLIELRCETDFVAKNSEFQGLAHDLALQVAAGGASYVSPQEIPAEVIEAERNIARTQLAAEGKPAAMIDKIVEGKLQKWYAESCLLNQAFIKDETVTVQQLIERLVAKIGEKIEVGKFVRLTA